MNDADCCKVGTLIGKYDLDSPRTADDSLDDYLLSRWLGDDETQSVGYRTLTEWFNKRLLKKAYDGTGRSAMGNRLESDYEALTDDGLVKMDTIDDLEADGIDAEAVLDDMISWSTMRNHLNECLDEKKERAEAETNWELTSVEIACDQTKQKVESALNSLVSKGKIDDEQDPDVEITVQLCCTKCPTRVPFDVAMNRGYVCADHRAETEEKEQAVIQVNDRDSEETFYWATSVPRQQMPSFGV
ncbi:rod-determining factor RdfA [Natrarchaeobius halalkaliphilus]|uniref:rod-determining factor RdfA n=1 Tax=Natrarchaeobius halalkaliphilus TaxID=1679091 RepID=UPI001AA003C4|nr:rod-determining factor RdfA [Natrarchaeobius halalkaliphilus]